MLQVTVGPVPPGGPVPVAVVGDAGGPTGSERAVRLAATAPAPMLAGTAFYGVDLRGTGNSEPVDCITPSTREALVDADPLAADPVSLAPLREAATTAARTCTQVLENALTDYRTGVDAEDLEEVRITLGVDRLHVVGVGDGAGVLATWARRYPASVGRTVLDGVADPTTTFSQRARERAAAAREALTAFASDCTARPDCPLGPDPAGVVTGILTNVRAAPLTGADGRRVTDGTVTRALVTGLAEPARWPGLATAIASAGQGDPAGILGLLAPLEVDGGGFDAGVLLTCNDTVERPTPDQVATRRRTGPRRRPAVRGVLRPRRPAVRVVAGAHRGARGGPRGRPAVAGRRHPRRPGDPARGLGAGHDAAGLGHARHLARRRPRRLPGDALHQRRRRRLPARRRPAPGGDGLSPLRGS